MAEHRVPVMAYSPIEQAKLAADARLQSLAKKSGVTAAQLALAWVLSRENVIAIPKTSRRERVKENAAAAEMKLSAEQLAELDRLFPPPTRVTPLEML